MLVIGREATSRSVDDAYCIRFLTITEKGFEDANHEVIRPNFTAPHHIRI